MKYTSIVLSCVQTHGCGYEVAGQDILVDMEMSSCTSAYHFEGDVSDCKIVFVWKVSLSDFITGVTMMNIQYYTNSKILGLHVTLRDLHTRNPIFSCFFQAQHVFPEADYNTLTFRVLNPVNPLFLFISESSPSPSCFHKFLTFSGLGKVLQGWANMTGVAKRCCRSVSTQKW
jgi:hypothetical protein